MHSELDSIIRPVENLIIKAMELVQRMHINGKFDRIGTDIMHVEHWLFRNSRIFTG
jgi:hypothetical protein